MRKEMNMKKKVLAVLLALAMVSGVICSCSSETADEAEASESSKAAATEDIAETEAPAETTEGADASESADADSIYPLTYVDPYGNATVIESEPQTIVTVSPMVTEIIYALGAQDKLIGRSDYDDYPMEVFDIQTVGPIDLPDTELIASLEPDIVIVSSIFSEEAYNSLTALGIPVCIVVDEDSFAGMIDSVEVIADLAGVHDAGLELSAELSEEYAAYAALQETDADAQDVTVYYAMTFGEYGDYTGGNGTFIDEIIELAGYTNAADDTEGWEYSVEKLIENDPTFILVPEWGYDLFITSEPYSSLTAVQEGRVIAVDANLFERQGPRNFEAVQLIKDAVNEYLGELDAAA